ncbi:MAG: hypothetical protein H6831_07385 [Planctomycetes bacterium]|nr:hypothetical protein [Planctomycetota bacterium]MCB9904215.1 hypothetical protein [Planctomycetota bacterium]
MHSLCATALFGLLALQAGAPVSEGSQPSEPVALPAPVRLAPVAGDTTCVFFDEGEMRARLLDPDLAAREQAYDELVALARGHTAIRATVEAWGRESTSLELAWTARLVMRELRREIQQMVAGEQQQFLRIEVHDPRPWQRDYQRQMLMQLGINPDEYRISGLMRLTPEDMARLGITPPANPRETAPSPTPGAPVSEVLGVACDESLDDLVILTRVVPGSIADSIGLTSGDRLLRVAGLDLTGPADVSAAMDLWNERGEAASDVLEVLALDGKTGESKTLVWIPPVGR